MKNILLILPIILVASSAIADTTIITISNLDGLSFDYNKGIVKESESHFSSNLTVQIADKSITLDTGATKLKNGSLTSVSDQLSFTFSSEAALWLITCYPKLELAFVNVHSDASEYGGAKMLSYKGICQAHDI